MNKAITASGVAGAASAGGIGLMSAALGVVVAGAVAAVAAITAVTAGLFALGKAGVETATSVESAFAGVLKTTQGLGTNLFDLTAAGEQVFQQFRDMATQIPLTFEELADIGQLVGQLGVAEDQIVGVTEVIAALGVSTNLSIQDAALVVSRFANVMSATGDVTTEQFERISSALVFLGNNFKARESEIILTARNIAGAASLVGMSEADVLALGTAVIEAGVTAEAGGSAIQNTITTITQAVTGGGKALKLFGDTAGLTAKEFSELWRTDATEAFTLFIQGLTEQGVDAIDTLDDLDLAQRRSIRTLLGISKESVDLGRIIDESNAAFERNTALSREAQIRYETFESQVQVLKNRLRDMGITIGLELIPRLLEIVDKIEPVVAALGENLQPIIETISDTIETKLLPALGDLLDAFGVDLSAEGIVQGIENLGRSISTHIENFTKFVEKVTELVELSKKKGLPGFLEGLGVPEENSQSFADAAKAIGIFVLAVKGLSIIAGVIATIATIGPALAEVGAFLALVGGAIAGGGGIGTVLTGIATAIVALLGPVGALIAALALLFTTIVTIGPQALETFKSLVGQLWLIMQLVGAAIIEAVAGWLEQVLPAIAGFISGVARFFVVTLPTTLGEIASAVGAWAVGVWDSIVNFFTQTMPQASEDILQTIIAFAQEVTENMKAQIIDFWETKWPDIRNSFRAAGSKIVTGFIKGIQARVKWALAQIAKFAQQLADAAKSALGITSPSKVFAEIGENAMLGLVKGIKNMAMQPQVAMVSSLNQMVGAGMQSVPASSVSSSNVSRDLNFGDINMTAQPESPQSMALLMQQLALIQGAA